MSATIISGIVALVGIISTIVAWKYNPKGAVNRELDKIYKELEELYAKRDKALQDHDNDSLTVITSDIMRLCARKTVLLQRLK